MKTRLYVSIIFYNLLILIFSPIIILFFTVGSVFDFKTIPGNLYRFGFKHPLKSKNKNLWLHGASVGEMSSLKNLIALIINKTDYTIYISTTTYTGYNNAKKMYNKYSDRIHLFYLPLDYFFLTDLFLKNINPEKLIITEIEIWPNLLFSAYKKNIPVHLINGRIGKDEIFNYKLLSPFFIPIYNIYNQIISQSSADTANMIKTGMPADKILTLSNIKYDFSIDLDTDRITQIQNLINPDSQFKIIVCGSTHKTEEINILKNLIQLKNFDKYKIVFAPRNTNRAFKIKQEFKNINMKCSFYSQNDISNSPLIIVDTIGDLLYFYKIADLVIMGGSFVEKVGGHNLLEPVLLHKLTITGPSMYNFQQITNELINKNGIIQAESYKDIKNIIENITPEKKNKLLSNAAALMQSKQGATEKVFNNIFNI